MATGYWLLATDYWLIETRQVVRLYGKAVVMYSVSGAERACPAYQPGSAANLGNSGSTVR